jgi:hypothetical protein
MWRPSDVSPQVSPEKTKEPQAVPPSERHGVSHPSAIPCVSLRLPFSVEFSGPGCSDDGPFCWLRVGLRVGLRATARRADALPLALPLAEARWASGMA